MKCLVCKKPTDSLKTAIKNGVYVSERCEKCLNSFVANAAYARKYNRDRQREDYRKDIIQRWRGNEPDPEFIKAYPKESAEQWGEDILRTV